MGVRRMFVTVVAVLCQISGVGCVEEIVTDSNLTPGSHFLSARKAHKRRQSKLKAPRRGARK